MVYCQKCGTENEDDASNCVNCGEPLTGTRRVRRNREYEIEDRDRDDMCFGGNSRTMWPLVIGVFIILIGLSSLLENTYSWARFDNIWPFFLIALGAIILYNRFQR